MLDRIMTSEFAFNYRMFPFAPTLIETKDIEDTLSVLDKFGLAKLPGIKSLTSLFSHVGLAQVVSTFGILGALLPADFITEKLVPKDKGLLALHYDAMESAIGFPFPFLSKMGPTQPDQEVESWNSTLETQKLLQIDQAKTEGFTGKGVKVAVLDTGVMPVHPQFRGDIDFYSAMADKQIQDANGHGTHCASTVYGYKATSPTFGITTEGMAPGCKKISIKCLGYGLGFGRSSDVLKAIEMAFKLKADIISMSLGGDKKDPQNDPGCRAINALTQKYNMICVIAAGNSGRAGTKTILSPGAAKEALTVGAIDPRTKQITDFSSRGPTNHGLTKPDVVAPGLKIYSGSTGILDQVDKVPDSWVSISGTSMATPHIAGMCALLRELDPTFSTARFKEVMTKYGGQKNNTYGWGLPTWEMFKTELKER